MRGVSQNQIMQQKLQRFVTVYERLLKKCVWNIPLCRLYDLVVHVNDLVAHVNVSGLGWVKMVCLRMVDLMGIDMVDH